MELIINKKGLEIKIVDIEMEKNECILYLRITPYGQETIKTYGYYRNKKIYSTFKIENKKYQGINLENHEDICNICENLIEEQKKLITDAINKLLNEELLIHVVQYGYDYAYYCAEIGKHGEYLNDYSNEIIEGALKILFKDKFASKEQLIDSRLKFMHKEEIEKLGKNIVRGEKILDMGTLPADNIKSFDITLKNASNYEYRMKKKKEAEDNLNSLFEVAKKTGIKQKIQSWSEDCNDPNEDCSLDIITVYAMPDGTKKVERNHTW